MCDSLTSSGLLLGKVEIVWNCTHLLQLDTIYTTSGRKVYTEKYFWKCPNLLLFKLQKVAKSSSNLITWELLKILNEKFCLSDCDCLCCENLDFSVAFLRFLDFSTCHDQIMLHWNHLPFQLLISASYVSFLLSQKSETEMLFRQLSQSKCDFS